MKKFKLKFEIKYILLAFLGIAICIVGFGLNLWRCIAKGGFTDFYSSLQYIIIGVVTVFAPVLLLCVVFSSKYILTEKEFITCFGFIKSNFSIADMTSIIYDDEKCSLTIYTGETYMVFKLVREWHEEFIDELRKRNKNLLYNEADNFEKKNKTDSDDRNNDEKK